MKAVKDLVSPEDWTFLLRHDKCVYNYNKATLGVCGCWSSLALEFHECSIWSFVSLHYPFIIVKETCDENTENHQLVDVSLIFRQILTAYRRHMLDNFKSKESWHLDLETDKATALCIAVFNEDEIDLGEYNIFFKLFICSILPAAAPEIISSHRRK